MKRILNPATIGLLSLLLSFSALAQKSSPFHVFPYGLEPGKTRFHKLQPAGSCIYTERNRCLSYEMNSGGVLTFTPQGVLTSIQYSKLCDTLNREIPWNIPGIQFSNSMRNGISAGAFDTLLHANGIRKMRTERLPNGQEIIIWFKAGKYHYRARFNSGSNYQFHVYRCKNDNSDHNYRPGLYLLEAAKSYRFYQHWPLLKKFYTD